MTDRDVAMAVIAAGLLTFSGFALVSGALSFIFGSNTFLGLAAVLIAASGYQLYQLWSSLDLAHPTPTVSTDGGETEAGALNRHPNDSDDS